MASKDWQGTFATSRESLHRVETRLNLARRALTKADMSSPVRHAVDALAEIATIHLAMLDDLRAGMEDD
jgi:hypothetical protein